MKYKKLKEINMYEGKNVNPLKFPEEVFEMYSVPSFEDKYPEIITGIDIGSTKQSVKKGDILLCKINPRINRVWVVNKFTENRLLASSEWIVIRNNEIDSKYLMWYFRSEYFRKLMMSNVTGMGGSLMRAQPKQVSEYLIPIIDYEKQIQIVNVLDKAQRLIDKRKEQIEALDELVKSKFIEMFGSPLEKKFNGKTLPEITTDDKYSLKRGPFGGSLKKDDFIQEGYLVYEQRHAIHNDFDYAKYFISKEKYEDMIMFKVEPNDLLVSCSGVTLGRISEVPKGAKAGIINQALLKITLNKEIMNNSYFIQLFRNEQIQDKLFGFSRGSGIPNFPSMNEVKSMEFLCPPIEIQNQFGDFVKQVDKIRIEMENSLKELEDNFNSLMQKAFKGELFN